MNPYNGFSSSQRNAVEDILKKAFYKGTYTPAPVCELCALPGIIKSKNIAPHLMFHCEDYGRPFDATIICVECHLRLHARFHTPNRWRQHCLSIREVPARPWASVQTYFGATRSENRDLGEVTLDPLPGRWWERLSYDEALKKPIEPGMRAVFRYGPSNRVDSLVVTIEHDDEFVEQPRLI